MDKKSIFWDLPYWKDNLLRHYLDVLHIEKNFSDNIFNTVMDVKGKTKDNDKATKDLALHCRRPDLELKLQANGKTLKPKANYTLTIGEFKLVYQSIKELCMPDGYSSNLARCVDVDKERILGMKSHYYNIFMECLLPITFHSLPIDITQVATKMTKEAKEKAHGELSSQRPIHKPTKDHMDLITPTILPFGLLIRYKYVVNNWAQFRGPNSKDRLE